MLVGLQQPSLRTREAALTALTETRPSLPIGELLHLLLSSSFTEKDWLASLVAAGGACIEDHCSTGNESQVGDVLFCLEAEFQRSKTLQKSILIGRLIAEGGVFRDIVERASEQLELYHRLRQLYFNILEHALLHHAPTYEYLEKRAVSLFGPNFSELFDVSYVSSLTIHVLAVVARLLRASAFSNDEFRSSVIEEFVKRTITA